MTCSDCEILKENVDSHIKILNKRISNLEDLPSIVNENTDNIQHNYELIYELKDSIEELTQEINATKLIQIITLKQKIGSPITESEHKEIINIGKKIKKSNT